MMTEAQFAASVQTELHRIQRRAALEVEIDSLRDDVRQLCDADTRLQQERLDVFRRKCSAVAKLWRLEHELESLCRRGVA